MLMQHKYDICEQHSHKNAFKLPTYNIFHQNEACFQFQKWPFYMKLYTIKIFSKTQRFKVDDFLCILEQFLALVKKNDNHTYAFLEIPHRGMENNH